MPLIKSSSDPAFKRNVSTLMKEVGQSPHVQSRQQALAIAYDVKRKNCAGGGLTLPHNDWQVRSEAHSMMHSGPISSIVGGRTDHHPMRVPAGSYVLPADHVSSLGQGNTANGMAVLGHMFSQGPYGSSPGKITHGPGAPRAPVPKLGAAASGGGAQGAPGEAVPIYAAGGEYVIPPEIVARIGNGNLEHGHQILDHWVKSNRDKHIKTLKNLPPPAKK